MFKRICLLLCLFFPIALFSQQKPVAIEGVLDLRGTKYSKNESIALDGEWAFVWNQFLGEKEFNEQIKQGNVHWVKVPNYWSAYKKQIPEISSSGYATYHLTILVDRDVEIVSFLAPEILSSYQFIVNGDSIQRNGKPGLTKESTQPAAEAEFFDARPKDGVVNLIIQTANYHHSHGGIWSNIFVGPKEPLRNLAIGKIAWDIFLLGWLLGFGIYHFGIYFQRMEDKANLFFGLFCIILSIRVLLGSFLPLEDWFGISWYSFYRISYLSTYSVAPLLAYYLKSLYPAEFSSRILKIITYISVGLCLVVLLRPPIVFTKTFPIFAIFTTLLLFYYLVILTLCILHKRDSALVFFFVFMVLSAASISEILDTNAIIKSSHLFNAALALFIVVQSGVITRRFTKALTLSEELTHRMEAKISERTKELLTAKEHAQALATKAEEANNAKSTFLATMSHEIRTPMNGIIGMASLMGHTKLDDRQKGYLQTIKSSGETLLNLINSILDFSKIEAGKVKLEEIPFSLRNTVDDCMHLVLPKVHEKGLQLSLHFAHNIPDVVIGDPTRIKQVVSNLLSNAVKFTEKGTVHVNAGIKLSNEETVLIRFAVVDSGIGISNDQKKKLFQSFTQLDDSTTRKYGGTGLGLAICKRLIHLMQGRLWVDSTPEKGATFFFEVPLKQLHSSRENNLPINKMQNGKVLVLLENDLLFDCLREDFAYFGYLSQKCQTPDEVTQIIQKENIGLVIFDSTRDIDKTVLESWYPHKLCLHNRGKKTDDTEEVSNAYIPAKRSLLSEILKKTNSDRPKNITNLIRKEDPISSFSKQYPLQVLIAEDDPNNQNVAKLMLATLGYEVEIADNGREAIEKLGTKSFDVILMDIQMPEMDGFETTKTIIENWKETERPYIIAVTAFALRGDRKKAIESGMNDYLSKPITIDPLCEKLRIAYKHIKQRKKKA